MRLRVEFTVENEDPLVAVEGETGHFSILISKFVAGPVLHSHYFAGESGVQVNPKHSVGSRSIEPTTASVLNKRVRTPRPVPRLGHVAFASDGFGALLEFWGLLANFSSFLGMDSVPSARRLEAALKVNSF